MLLYAPILLPKYHSSTGLGTDSFRKHAPRVVVVLETSDVRHLLWQDLVVNKPNTPAICIETTGK